MAGKYRAYSEYKDSGVDWLGYIPEHWFVAPLKWQIERNDGGVWGNDPDGIDDTIVLRSTEQTVDGNWKLDDPAPRKINANEKAFALLKTGDLLVTKSSGSSIHIGKTTLVSIEIEAMECCYSNFMQRIRTKSSLMPKLAWYVMNNNLARKQFDFLSNTTTGLANLNGTMMGQILLTVPKVEEQRRIIAFLDHETAKIDTLIEKQQQLIQLLKEKRQAVISHAVTKGLNPNAPMCDSGIEWLGEVPEHWSIKKLKYLGVARNGLTYAPNDIVEQGEGVLVLRSSNVQNMKITFDDNVFVNKHIQERMITKVNDILICSRNGSRALIGKNALIDDDSAGLSYGAFMMIYRSEINPYLLYVFNSALFSFQSGTFLTSTINQLTVENIDGFEVPVPPNEEREEIIGYLKNKTKKIDDLIAKAESAVVFIQERRTALISAAVTGKIDVRNWQAPGYFHNNQEINGEVAA
jgi:type I restriction enzyme S subunit